jgi:branched-chain amino acid transport system permease protein
VINWDQFVQLTVNGLTDGAVYALIALGFSIVYGILKLLNFAQGDVFMIGAFIGYFVLTGFGGPANPEMPIPLLIVLMFLFAMIGCGLLGVVIERFAYRPLRNAPRIAPLISALGVSFFLQNSALLLFGPEIRSYDTFELGGGTYAFPSSGIQWGPLNLSILRMLTIGLAIIICVLLTLLIARTQIGKAMRATAIDREAATMMGIDTDRVIAFAFLVGSAISGAAGVMFGLLLDNISNTIGFENGLKAFTAAVIGGIGSIPGAMLGGLVVGLAEAYSAGYLPGGVTFQDVWVFSLLILVLLIRPTGLLGKTDIRKV